MNARTSALGAPGPSQARRTTATVADLSVRGTVKVALRIAGGVTVSVIVIAIIVRVGYAAEARRWLAYPFAGVPARLGESATIFLHNLRALAAVAGLLLIPQSPYWDGKTEPGTAQRAVQGVGEALLAAGVAANVIVVGVSVGAYGERMISAILPHGPVELAAYALALALYLQGRGGPLPARHVLAITALSISVLALAAALETFVNR